MILNTIGFDKKNWAQIFIIGRYVCGLLSRDNLNFAKFLKKQNINNELPKVIDKLMTCSLIDILMFIKKKNFIKNKPKLEFVV